MRGKGLRQVADSAHQGGQPGAHAWEGVRSVVVMGDAGEDRGQHGGLCTAKGFSSDQFGDEQRVIDANQSGPFTFVRQSARWREVPERLKDFDLGLKPVPEPISEGLNGFCMAMGLLPKARGEGDVFSAGGTGRTGGTGKFVDHRADHITFRFIG